MTEPNEASAPALELWGETEPALERVSAPPILISEPEVAFSTVAAVGAQQRTTRWWIRATRVIAATPSLVFATLTADSRRPRSDCPRRYRFLEDALMAREMHRL